jgi:hypothetical protein
MILKHWLFVIMTEKYLNSDIVFSGSLLLLHLLLSIIKIMVIPEENCQVYEGKEFFPLTAELTKIDYLS